MPVSSTDEQQQYRRRRRSNEGSTRTVKQNIVYPVVNRFNVIHDKSSIFLFLLVLVSAVTLFGNDHIVLAQQNETGLSGKDIPEKGDTKCPSLADRYNSFKNNAVDTWLLPCEEDTVQNIDTESLPDHAIVLTVYTALPAFSTDFRNLLSWGVVGYLDEVSFEYDVTSNFSIPVDVFNYTERRGSYVTDASIVFQYVTATQVKNNNDVSWWFQYQLVFFCFYGSAHQDKVRQPITKYDMVSITTTNGTSSTKSNIYKLRSIEQRLNYYLRECIDFVNLFEIRQLSYGVLGVSVQDPRESTTPFEDGPPTISPTMSPTYDTYNETEIPNGDGDSGSDEGDPDDGDGINEDDSIDIGNPEKNYTDGRGNDLPPPGSDGQDNNVNGPSGEYPDEYIIYTSPINVQDWDWRRFLGLFFFGFTLLGTIILTQLAQYRRRQLTKQTLWGNIGTEEGLDALLNTGWKLPKNGSTMMEVYNKEGIGYRDDDSILLGGYEQSSGAGNNNYNTSSEEHYDTNNTMLSYGIGGGEINVTPDGSYTTPEYNNVTDEGS